MRNGEVIFQSPLFFSLRAWKKRVATGPSGARDVYPSFLIGSAWVFALGEPRRSKQERVFLSQFQFKCAYVCVGGDVFSHRKGRMFRPLPWKDLEDRSVRKLAVQFRWKFEFVVSCLSVFPNSDFASGFALLLSSTFLFAFPAQRTIRKKYSAFVIC